MEKQLYPVRKTINNHVLIHIGLYRLKTSKVAPLKTQNFVSLNKDNFQC